MYLTVKNQIRGLSVKEYDALRELCRLSKNLYNEALYNVRQYYFSEKKFLRYESNYHLCKTSENYAMLHTDVAQQTMKIVDRNYQIFFSSIKNMTAGNTQKKYISIPRYLPKDGFYTLIAPRIIIKNEQFSFPVSRTFKKEYGTVTFSIPKILKEKKIKEVRIHPVCNAKFFEIEYVYEQEKYKHNFNYEKFLGIDFGLDNLATCATNDGASFIIDGKQIKSYNRLFIKENARLQSIKAKQGIKGTTKKQYLNSRKRKRRMNHALSVASSKIVKYCIENEIGNIVVGCVGEWKKKTNMGKTNNQNFGYIPYRILRSKIKYQCELHGINYIEQEESFTSKASFFDNDIMPSYKKTIAGDCKFSGKRISRGQYKTSDGYVFNADVNAALNILRKCNLVSLKTLQTSGCVSQPCRIKVF